VRDLLVADCEVENGIRAVVYEARGGLSAREFDDEGGAAAELMVLPAGGASGIPREPYRGKVDKLSESAFDRN
jgi:hypothetical protein